MDLSALKIEDLLTCHQDFGDFQIHIKQLFNDKETVESPKVVEVDL